ncbi:Hpt domain protein [compost metagenome]
MREALPRGGFDVLMDLAHRLAGTGASYGFDALSRLGFALEAAAEASDRARVADLLNALEAALANATPRG